MASVKARIETLRTEIREHAHRYYILDDPIVSDAQYDALMVQLREIERSNPDLVTADSPTQRVGAPVGDLFQSVRHLRPLFSLDNAETAEDLAAWEQRMERLLESEPSGVRM